MVYLLFSCSSRIVVGPYIFDFPLAIFLFFCVCHRIILCLIFLFQFFLFHWNFLSSISLYAVHVFCSTNILDSSSLSALKFLNFYALLIVFFFFGDSMLYFDGSVIFFHEFRFQIKYRSINHSERSFYINSVTRRPKQAILVKFKFILLN